MPCRSENGCIAVRQYIRFYLANLRTSSRKGSDASFCASTSYRIQNKTVRSVDNRNVQRSEVNLRRTFGIVPHSFTYHRNRYILALCDRSPRVAGNVHCKRQRHSGHPAYGLQIPVHQAHRALILNPRISVGTLYYRKKILASARIVPACNLLHAPFPLHGKPLARFPPAVGEHAVAQIFLTQKGHIHKGHSPGIKGKEKHIAGKGHTAVPRQFQLLYPFDIVYRERPFYASVHFPYRHV